MNTIVILRFKRKEEVNDLNRKSANRLDDNRKESKEAM